jgi:benzodiazapine receptor
MKRNTLRLKWWQMALVTLAVSFAGRLSSGKSKNKNHNTYSNQLKQAPWAPPAWVFAPAWLVNNFFDLLALQKIWNMEDSDQRTKLLRLQVGIWLIFFSFNYIYFNKKSTLLAAAWTNADAVLAIASFLTALKTDKNLARFFLPLVTWTSFASTVADYQALYNKDQWLKTKAILN